MTADEETFRYLGRELVRMIHDVRQIAQNGDVSYVRRLLSFPGGEVEILLASNSALADRMEEGAKRRYDVHEATPPSQLN